MQDGQTTHNEEAISGIYNDEAVTNTSNSELITTHVSGDFMEYMYIDELASRATYIVRVEVLDERVERIDIGIPPTSRYEINTVNRLEVLHVFKGDMEIGKIMEVRQFGGQLGNEKFICSHRTTLPIGDDLVLFLACLGIDNRPARLVNPVQSIYRFASLNADESIRSFNDELEVLNDRNNLTLTFDDLSRFSETYMD